MALTYDYIHLIQGATDLDLAGAAAGATGFIVVTWEPKQSKPRQTRHVTSFKHGADIRSVNYDNVQETFNLTIYGASHDDLMNRIQTLYALQEGAKENAQRPPNVKANPVYIVYQSRFATNPSRSEVFAIDIQPVQGSWTGADLIANRSSFTVTIEREPFWNSTVSNLVPTLSAVTLTNNGNAFTDVTGVLGAVFAPMQIGVQASVGNSANANLLIVGLRRYYTPSQFVNYYAGATGQLFSDSLLLNSTNFWGGGGNNGVRVTPTSKVGDGTGKRIARWFNSTNVQSQYGSFHVFARCRDNAGATPSFKVRMRAGITVSGSGSVMQIAVTNGGSGYTSVPSVTIAAPPAGGVQATATAVLNGTVVSYIVITNPGSGYTALNPGVTFGGPGINAAATATTYTDFFGDWTTTAVAAGAVGGTTEFYLLDLGRLDIPPVNVNGQAVSTLVYELWGDSTLASAWTTFDVDYFYLIPIGESDNDTGILQATFPAALGSLFQANVDTRQNIGPIPAYETLVSGGALALTPSSYAGRGIYYYPGITNRIFFILARSDGRHDYTTSLSSIASLYIWRGLYPRGTT